MVDKKTLLIVLAVSVLSSLATAMITTAYFSSFTVNMYSGVGLDFETHSIHCRIRMWQNEEKVFDQYHAGKVTELGENMTLAWIFGDSDYNVTEYMCNVTYISIGNKGSLSESSVVLPGEWNRTAGVIDNEHQSYLNISCTFYPDNVGYTADCIGLNWNSTASSTGNLWAYDEFTEVTGIDETFTINVDFKITVSDA